MNRGIGLLVVFFLFLFDTLYGLNTYYLPKYPGKAKAEQLADELVLENSALKLTWKSHPYLQLDKLWNKYDNTCLDLSDIYLFAIQFEDGTLLTNADFRLDKMVRKIDFAKTDSLPTPALSYPGIGFDAELVREDRNIRLRWSAELRDDANYVRQKIKIIPQSKSVKIRKVFFLDGTLKGASISGTVLGCPIIYQNNFFAMEHPVAHSKALRMRLAGALSDKKMDVSHFVTEAGVYGLSLEHGGGEDDFNVLEAAILADGKKVAIDKHPLNGENGSNQYFLNIKDIDKNKTYELRLTLKNPEKATGRVFIYQKKPDLLNFYVERKDEIHLGQEIEESAVIGVAPDKSMRRYFQYYISRERACPYRHFLHYNCWWDITDDGASYFESEQLIERMHAWNKKFIEPYHIKLHSFVFDDGWDDTNHVWYFHPERFPKGFTEQAALCEKYNSGIGVWMSPFGGYLQAQRERIKAAKREGLEVNRKGLSLAGKRYYQRFLDRSLDMIRNYHVNYFKYDGFGGSEPEFLPDMEAGIRLIQTLRQEDPDLFINITAGTWPSPFWLRYADCTWRSSGDLHQAGEGNPTQKFMTYRDGTLHNNIIARSTYYPLNSIMTVGIAYAHLGHPSRFVSDDVKGFKDMVRSFFSMGSGLQELYISHDKMKDEFWPILAEAVHWAKKRKNLLEDSHWVGGSPINLQVYGFASWNGTDGILSLRNPSSKEQTFVIDLDKIMEDNLPKDKIFRLQCPWKDSQQRYDFNMKVNKKKTIVLKPFEQIVWDVQSDE